MFYFLNINCSLKGLNFEFLETEVFDMYDIKFNIIREVSLRRFIDDFHNICKMELACILLEQV